MSYVYGWIWIHKNPVIVLLFKILNSSTIHPSAHTLIAYNFRIMISFLAALRTFLPSFLRNFLQTNTLSVCLSFARHSSQNSFLRNKNKIDRNTDRSREKETVSVTERMKYMALHQWKIKTQKCLQLLYAFIFKTHLWEILSQWRCKII